MLDARKRKRAIGGSECSAVVGCNPYMDEHTLWLRKHDMVPEQEPSERMIRGKFLEPAVLDIYAYKTGRTVQRVDTTIVCEDRPYMAATVDARADDGRIVEAKVVAFDQRQHWTEVSAPPHAELQVRWYMSALNVDLADIVALVGDKVFIYTIERDHQLDGAIGAICKNWWERFIVGWEEPPLGGSQATTDWLQHRYPHHARPDIREATPDEIELLTQYSEIRAEHKELKIQRGAMENQLRAAVGAREGIAFNGNQFTWRRTKDGAEVDWKSMALALRTEFIKDEEERQRLTDRYTAIKPGKRRIHVSGALFTMEAEEEAAA